MIERAPAKVNLALHVGARRGDGLHFLCSLFASVDLHDDVTLRTSDADAVVCPEVAGENLAAQALSAFRDAAPDARLPPMRVEIQKRIPVAAGLGGGSADAAAVLRAANQISGAPLDDDGLREAAAPLGSDVPSQVRPAHAVVSGTGELVEPVGLPAITLVLLPARQGLSTGAVYSELDRLRGRGVAPARERLDPEPLRRLANAPVRDLAAALENDLEAAALSLRPELASALDRLREAGAIGARITGSGPTAFGVFADRESAARAARDLPGAIVTATAP